MRLLRALALLLPAAPAWAQIASVDTPSGLARVEGDLAEQGDRLVVGEEVVIPPEPFIGLWIEAQVGRSDGGTLCRAEWVWVHTAPNDLR